MIFQHEKLGVRELINGDEVLLGKWLSDPKVLQYYEGRDNPFDVNKIKLKFFNRKDEETRCIVEYNEKPIGYIQFYPIENEERAIYGYDNDDEIIYGTDQFIGETEFWNRGIGTLLIKSMIHYLVTEKKASRVVMDPQAWNQRAITAYEKCGMKKVKLLPKHELHEGEFQDCWLMEYKIDL